MVFKANKPVTTADLEEMSKPTPSSSINPLDSKAPAESPAPVDRQAVKKGILVTAGVIFSLIFLFWVASSVVPQALVYLTKAANTPGRYSLTNSYIFGSPLLAAADGQEKIRVSVFLLDPKGKGVPDKKIDLKVTAKADVTGQAVMTELQPMTNSSGLATFEVTSVSPGQFVAAASVDSFDIPQTVTMTFR